LFDILSFGLYYALAVINRLLCFTIGRIMSKILAYVFAMLLVLVTVAGFSGCEDNPVRPKGPQKPDCWKPLVNLDELAGQADWAPEWSNDGTRIAFFSFYDSCNSERASIYISDISALHREPIGIVGTSIRWLPGDTQLVIGTGFSGGEIIIYNLNSGAIERLGVFTRLPFMDVTADGRYIYYEGQPLTQDSIVAVYRYDRQTGEDKAIVQGFAPSISPDGNLLLYAYNTFKVLNMADLSITELPGGGLESDWSPDGREIVYQTSVGEIWAVTLSGKQRKVFAQKEPLGDTGPISISPDGKSFLFLRVSQDNFYHVWRADVDGTWGCPITD
jgi:Tol biopolymer transport system component